MLSAGDLPDDPGIKVASPGRWIALHCMPGMVEGISEEEMEPSHPRQMRAAD